MKRKVMVMEKEDPSRGLLETCKHKAPACWRCVADDMERQRDEARRTIDAKDQALRDAESEFAGWLDACERDLYAARAERDEARTERDVALAALQAAEADPRTSGRGSLCVFNGRAAIGDIAALVEGAMAMLTGNRAARGMGAVMVRSALVAIGRLNPSKRSSASED